MASPQSVVNPAKPRRMGQLEVSNHLLGDRKALQAAWDRDGYWYFKGVLDRQLIADMRQQWISCLQERGLIDKGINENRYNGTGSFDDFVNPNSVAVPTNKTVSRLIEFNHRNLHTMLTENPAVNATMKQILGDDPFWLPIAEYRANAPGDNPNADRFIYVHQDGFYSRDMPMKICWIPIDSVDEEVGGCAWVGGVHKGPILHDVNNPPVFPIPESSIPVDGWLRADYEPGDIVIFDLNTPHTGLTNLSKDRFRLTMDIRVTEASGHTPTIGSLVSLTDREVKVRNNKTGAEETYVVAAHTFVRGPNGQKREGADIPTTFQIGEQIIVNSLDKRTATLVRSIH